jgi:predicted Zn finger-like uncharacterized protein
MTGDVIGHSSFAIRKMPVEVACPSCLRSLRVREEHLGGQVRCPVCGAVFVAAQPPPTKPVTADPEPSPGEPRRRRRRRGGGRDQVMARLRPAAICMVVFGALVSVGYLVTFLLFMAGKNAAPEELLRGPLRSWVRGVEACHACLPLMGSAVIIVAGIKMLQREHYKIAMTGSILAMIPCTSGLGCFLGIPLGIWSLIVLRNPEVIAAFKVEGEEENLAEWPVENDL